MQAKTSDIIEAELKERGYHFESQEIDDFEYGEVCSFFFGYVRLEVYEDIPRVELSDESGSWVCYRFNLYDPNSIEAIFTILNDCICVNCTLCPDKGAFTKGP